MVKIGLFYGSSTGNTEFVSYQIKTEFEKSGTDTVEVHNIGASTPEQVLQYDYIIMGIPTWNTGELQDDWSFFFPKFSSMDFKGKRVAVFGLGDQNGYGFNFLDAMGMLCDEVLLRGAQLVGMWKLNRYEFEESKAKLEDHFVGLGVDQDGQSAFTEERVAQWVAQVRKEFALPVA